MTQTITPTLTDVELLNQHRNGSESAFADLVGRHLGWVYGLARRRLRDAHLADDVAQAVFILLHRKAPEFAADGAMIRWLYRTAWYASESAARSQRRRSSREIQYAVERPEAVEPAEPPEWKELAPVLDQLIGKLSRSDREAILLRYYRDLSTAEIAQQIGTTPEAARKRVERAVERLRTLAGDRGVPLSSATLAAGLTHFVRIPPPPGLLATSTVAATASPGSAMAASSASIVKGTLLMTTGTKVAIGSIAVLAVGLTVAAIGGTIWLLSSNPAPAVAQPAARPEPTITPATVVAPQRVIDPTPFTNDRVPRLAPWTCVRWHNELPEVQIRKTWYELIAINNIPVTQVIATDKQTDPRWQKHFAEDIVEIMGKMNYPLGNTVDLQLRTLDRAKLLTTLTNVPMTTSNRVDTLLQPEPDQRVLFAKFRWQNGTPQVQISDTWYELMAVQDWTTGELIRSAMSTDGIHWQAQFQMSIMDRLYPLNGPPIIAPAVRLQTLDTNELVTIFIPAPMPP